MRRTFIKERSWLNRIQLIAALQNHVPVFRTNNVAPGHVCAQISLMFPPNLITQERIWLIKSIRLCHDSINHIPLVSLSDSTLDTSARVSKSEN